MALPLNTLMVPRRGGLMANTTAWMAQQWNMRMSRRVVDSRGVPEIKTEMLGISGMRWYMATALECSSVVVDTMSWRGMVTHQKGSGWSVKTFYRNAKHRVDGPAVEWRDGNKEWWVDGKRHRVDGSAVETASSKHWYVDGKRHRMDGPAVEWYDGGKEWWVFGVRQK
jgi:hypothetical protein